jgi:hypothetical protein
MSRTRGDHKALLERTRGGMPGLMRLERALVDLPKAAWRLKLMAERSENGKRFQKEKKHHE